MKEEEGSCVMELSPPTQAEVECSRVLLTTRGRTGFDGGVEAVIAGGCAYHPKNGQTLKLKNEDNNLVPMAA